jgi:hypothetical protein
VVGADHAATEQPNEHGEEEEDEPTDEDSGESPLARMAAFSAPAVCV